jgi:hypothetical protein
MEIPNTMDFIATPFGRFDRVERFSRGRRRLRCSIFDNVGLGNFLEVLKKHPRICAKP